MKKVTCLLLVLLIGTACYSTTIIEKLAYDPETTASKSDVTMKPLGIDKYYLGSIIKLSYDPETTISNTGVTMKLLGIDKYNVDSLKELVRVYSDNNQKDSINYLFNRMIKENTKILEPYVIMAQLPRKTHTQQIGFYEEAYTLDSLHTQVYYLFGKIYYQLFRESNRFTYLKNNTDEYSRSSITYFSTLCNLDTSYREALSYPLLQLATYLGDADLIKRFEQFNVQQSHFPVSAFIDLPTDWQTNYRFNVMGMYYMKWSDALVIQEKNIIGVEYAKSRIDWYSSILRTLKEPVLNTLEAENVYRFTYLPSSGNPIVVGLVNTNHSINVYWKEGDRSGKLINEHTKTLTQEEWTAIDSAIHFNDFWNMPSINVDPLSLYLDDAEYIMEGKASGNYHVVDRESDDRILSIGNKLLKLTDLNISIGNER